MKYALGLLIVILIAGTAQAGFIQPDGAGGYMTSNGPIQSDGAGGYFTPNGHVQPDGAGGYFTPNGHIQSNGMGGYITPNGIIQPDGALRHTREKALEQEKYSASFDKDAAEQTLLSLDKAFFTLIKENRWHPSEEEQNGGTEAEN